jgi:DNA polymerase-3 subunit delta
VFSVETGFEWGELQVSADSLSIFSDKKLIDLRIPSGKPGVEGSKAMVRYCQRLPEETILLITAAKIDKASLKTKWFQVLDEAGVVVQVWPLEGADLLQWLQRRAQKRGLHIEGGGIKALAVRVEGNLLAASQEIEKLYILHGNSAISKPMVEEAVVDNARFDVFKLTDCVLSGRTGRVVKILNGLKAEDVAAPVVVWALAREIRLLIQIQIELKQGQNKPAVFKKHRVWDKRQHLVISALSRMKKETLRDALTLVSKADRQVKGQELGDCWETLLIICLAFCGFEISS